MAEELTRREAGDDVDEARAELARAVAAAEEMTAGDAGTDLVPARSNDPVEAKRQLARVQSELRKQQEVVRRAADRLERTMKREMERAEAVLGPMQEVVNRLQEGLFSVNLYLGRDEDVVLLRDGESAPAAQPITLRQLLLFMDEEMASVSAEGGFSPVKDIEAFDRWLLADPAHLDQVLPETKGIVALRPRRKQPREGYRDSDEAKANRRTYWLVRNGERVYRTVTLLELDDRVLPYADEMERLFMRRKRGGRVEPLQPGSFDWERAQEKAEGRELTYMRVGLVLEGLLHRTPIFHPLPEAGVSFLDPRDVRDGKVRYITDAEGLLGTGRESFAQWRRRLAEELRPGMRIVLGPGLGRHDYERQQGNSRLSPSIANRPAVGQLYVVDSRGRGRDYLSDRTGTQLVFRYREGERYVGDGGWGGGELREPKRRASCTVYAHDEFVLPFDLATVEEMERFLHSRTDRHEYEDMFPILKAAIAAKRREAEVEEPFRVMLAGVLARENGVSVEEAQQVVPDLVSWWKLKNRLHRPLLLEAARPDGAGEEGELSEDAEPLPSGRMSRRAQAAAVALRGHRERERQEAAEQVERSAKAVRMIVAEHARRLRDERRPIDERVVQQLREMYPAGRLVIARPRGRGYLVVVAAEPVKNVYVHEYEHTARGELKEAREWILPRLPATKTWRIVEAEERWGEWNFEAHEDQHLRAPEREELQRQALARFEANENALAVGVHRKTGHVMIWTFDEGADIDDSRPLTTHPSGPHIGAEEGKWRRAGGRASWHWREERAERISRHELRPPWEKLEWRSAFGDEEQEERRPEYVVLARNEKLIRELMIEVRRYVEADRRHGELRKRAMVLVNSVEQEWLRQQWEAERRRFDEDFGDPALWPSHRKTKERDIRFPSNWKLTHYAGSMDREPLLYEAVAHLVEVGEDPEGRTVADVLREASERWGDLWGEEDRWHTDEKPRKVAKAPRELHGYVLSTYSFEHDADPEPDDDDEFDDDLGFVDDMLAGVREAVAGDGREEPEFDFEAEAVEDGGIEA